VLSGQATNTNSIVIGLTRPSTFNRNIK